MSATASLLEVFSRLEDPRKARGIRHPFASIVSLTLLGMLARIREMEVLVRWATVNWDSLREPLGFDRDTPPCATTISQTLARCKVEDFQSALNDWLRYHVAEKAKASWQLMEKQPSKASMTKASRFICSTRLCMMSKQ